MGMPNINYASQVFRQIEDQLETDVLVIKSKGLEGLLKKAKEVYVDLDAAKIELRRTKQEKYSDVLAYSRPVMIKFNKIFNDSLDQNLVIGKVVIESLGLDESDPKSKALLEAFRNYNKAVEILDKNKEVREERTKLGKERAEYQMELQRKGFDKDKYKCVFNELDVVEYDDSLEGIFKIAAQFFERLDPKIQTSIMRIFEKFDAQGKLSKDLTSDRKSYIDLKKYFTRVQNQLTRKNEGFCSSEENSENKTKEA